MSALDGLNSYTSESESMDGEFIREKEAFRSFQTSRAVSTTFYSEDNNAASISKEDDKELDASSMPLVKDLKEFEEYTKEQAQGMGNFESVDEFLASDAWPKLTSNPHANESDESNEILNHSRTNETEQQIQTDLLDLSFLDSDETETTKQQQQEIQDAKKIQGLLSNAPLQLQKFAEYVSEISATLRLSSKEEYVKLIADLDNQNNLNESMTKAPTLDHQIEKNVFITQVPGMLKGISHASLPPTTEEKLQKPEITGMYSKVIESASFPGLKDQSKVLPNSVSLVKMYDLVFSTLDISSSKYHKWYKVLGSDASLYILKDSFWILWHILYHKNEEIQQELIQRMSDLYVSFFMNCKLRSKDEFFKLYPNILAHAVYQSFCHCFPKSKKTFGMIFKIKICDKVSEWMTGMRPPIPWCYEWVHPEMIFMSKKEEDSTVAPLEVKSAALTKMDLAEIKRQDVDLALGIKRQDASNNKSGKIDKKPSCQLGPGPKIQRVVFDIFKNSPVVDNYLSKIGFKRTRAPICVHRSEMMRDSIHPDIPTYRQILQESVEHTNKALKDYKDRMELAQKERLKLVNDMNQMIHRETAKANYVLARPQLIKEKADQVIQEMHEQAKAYKTKKMMDSIRTAEESFL